MQMLAEAMAAAFKKGNEGCFVCGDKSHLKKNCPKKHTEKIKTTKKPLGVCPQCHKGVHWAKNIDLSMMLKGTLFQETKRWGLPGWVPINKNQGYMPSFPSNLQHPAMLTSIYQP